MDAKNKNMHFKCEVGLALQHFFGWHQMSKWEWTKIMIYNLSGLEFFQCIKTVLSCSNLMWNMERNLSTKYTAINNISFSLIHFGQILLVLSNHPKIHSDLQNHEKYIFRMQIIFKCQDTTQIQYTYMSLY